MYTINYTNGRTTHDTLTLGEALDHLRAEYPDMVTCDNDPARLLVWESEADAEDDDGGRAVASVR